MVHVKFDIAQHSAESPQERALAQRLSELPEPSVDVLAGLYMSDNHGDKIQLYPRAREGETRRTDSQYPVVDSLFLAHYDAAAFGHMTDAVPTYGTKVSAALKIIYEMHESDPSAKCVVFSGYSRTLQLLELAMRQTHQLREILKDREILIDGTTKGSDRANILSTFREDPQAFVVLLSTGANNAGLTLTEATRLILLDPPAHPAMEAQLINRIHRIGQTKPVLISRLIMKGTVEERTLAMWKETHGDNGEGLDLAVGCMNTEPGSEGESRHAEKKEFLQKLKNIIGVQEVSS